MDSLPKSKLVKHQTIKKTATWKEGGNNYRLVATVRYDDECGNGHNTFAITGDIRENGREYMGGCVHEEIAQRIPELEPYIKWHLVSSDDPMYYIANTMYHASNRDLDAARSCAVWPEATDEELTSPVLKEKLEARLPYLMEEFKTAVESLGLEY